MALSFSIVGVAGDFTAAFDQNMSLEGVLSGETLVAMCAWEGLHG